MFDKLFGKKDFSLERLATLCHVVEAGSIVGAVGHNSTRQSQYSRQIGDLERFLEIELLDRSTKPFRVNDDGKLLSQISRSYFNALDDLVSACQNRPKRIVIGAGESLIQWILLPSVLPKLRESLPEATVIFRNLQTDHIIEGLNQGHVDLGFVRKSAVPDGLTSDGSFPFSYHLFIPRKFRAKLEPPINLNQVTGFPMAVLEGRGLFRRTLEELASSTDTILRNVVECSSGTQIASLVARKECCAILPSFAHSQLDQKTIDAVPVDGFERLERELCFAWNPKMTEFRPIIKEASKICART